jgi:hypothetical protein
MIEPTDLGSSESHPIDEARVVEAIREHVVFALEEGRQHAHIELESGGKEDRVLLADEFGQASFDASVDGVLA